MSSELIAGLVTGGMALLGVITGGVLTWVHGAWSEHRQRDRNARYLSIRVVCILDKYVDDCVPVTWDDGYCEGRPGGKDGYAQAQVQRPSFPSFPEDIDWKSIDYSLMYRLLSLARSAEAADQRIDAVWEHASPPDYEEAFEERQYQYAKLGLRVIALADELRNVYRIESAVIEDWNPAARLEAKRHEIDSARQARRLRHAQWTDGAPPIPAPSP